MADTTEEHELVEDFESGEQDSFPTNKRKKCLTSARVIRGVVILLCLSIIILVGVCISLIVVYTESDCEDSYDIPELQNQLIHQTREYQVTLKTSVMTSRAEFNQEWISVWNEMSQMVSLSISDMQEATRIQYYLDTSACGSSREVRVRNYQSGSEFATTLDIKSSSKLKSDACNVAFWPAEELVSNSSQKCEQDYHSDGSDKYSRETRFSFTEETHFVTCKDMATLLPWQFRSVRPYEWGVLVKQDGIDEYWWVGEFSGEVDQTRYKIATTLRYYSMDDLINDRTPRRGEWSIRVYSNGDGFEDQWNEDFVQDVEPIWKQFASLYH